MRMLLNVNLPHQPFNAAVTNGTAGSKLSRILEAIKPEAVYDAKTTREAARKRGICPVIPYRSNTIDKPKFFAKILYKARARIEQMMGKIKRFKRIAYAARRWQQTMPHSSHSSAASS